MKLLVLADGPESLSVVDEDGRVTGLLVCPDINAGYLSRKIVEEIRPIERSHGRA